MLGQKHILLATSNHISDDQHKAMSAEGCEDACLVKDPPHTASDLIFHILPPPHTWVEVGIILKVM
jgi:hypothetical protein